MIQVSEQTYTDAIHPFDVTSWGGDHHATWATRMEPIQTLRVGEHLDFVVGSDTEAAGVRGSAYRALPGMVTCRRIAPDLVRVTRVREVRDWQEIERLSRRLRCPTCHVQIGYCVNQKGHRTPTHVPRWRAAEKAHVA